MIRMGALTEQLPRAGQGARTFRLETGRSYLAVARFATTARAPPGCPGNGSSRWVAPPARLAITQDRNHVTGRITRATNPPYCQVDTIGNLGVAPSLRA